MVKKPQERNPTGKGGFGDHKEHISPGGWKSEDNITYQYNKILRMSDEELADFKPETQAQKIALKRIKIAVTELGLNDTKEITDRTEGKAPQTIDMTNDGGKFEPVRVEIINAQTDNSDTD